MDRAKACRHADTTPRADSPPRPAAAVLLAWPAGAQDESGGDVSVQGPERARIEARIAEVERDTAIDESVKTKILDLLNGALSRLDAAEQYRSHARDFTESIQAAPEELARIRGELDQPPQDPARAALDKIPPGASSKDIEPALAAEQAELASIEARLADLEQRWQEQQDRPAEARRQLDEIQRLLDEIEEELKVPPAPGEHPWLTEARRISFDARRQSRIAEMRMIEQELPTYDVRLELLTARRDLAAQRAAAAEARVNALREALAEQRRLEADRASRDAEQAREQAEAKDPALLPLAVENAAISKELVGVVAHTETMIASQKQIDAIYDKIRRDFADSQRRLQIAGLSAVVGSLLREQQKNLPPVRQYDRMKRELGDHSAAAGLDKVETEERLRDLADLDEAVQRFMDENVAAPTAELPEVEAEAHKLLRDRKDVLARLDQAYRIHVQQISELDIKLKQLIDVLRDYALFLDENLLWIPSRTFMGEGTLEDAAAALAWLFNPASWADCGGVFVNEAIDRPGYSLLFLLVLGALLWARRPLRRFMPAAAEKVGRIYSDRLALTMRALAATVLMALPGPLAAAYAAWLLAGSRTESGFPEVVGAGLKSIASVFIALQLLRWFACRSGVAEAHFHWPRRSVRLLRRNLIWLAAVVLPAAFVTAGAEFQGTVGGRDNPGRLGFLVGMLALTVFMYRILVPRKGLPADYIRDHPEGWLARLRYIWFFLALGIPLALVVLSVLGYHYTALHLQSRLFATIFLTAGAVFVYCLIIRWLQVAQQKLAIAKAREKLDAARQARAEREARAERQARADEENGESAPPAPEPAELDIAKINEQSTQLARTLLTLAVIVGLWLIWADVLPALNVLERVELWHYTATVEGGETSVPITLANVILALFVGILTMGAARNIPGVLEIAVLQHLPLEPGSRYAVTTICRYIITAIGVIAVFSIIGLRWSQIQWLVAALGVGLGFGLQEIVANFVSGLILFFERPIRVGDTVTVGAVNGTVTRIRIRATTITDWDRKELIVPNKNFITNELVNWTLSDPITRLSIPVGIAYGSDTELAYDTLMAVAGANPRVLDKPRPRVQFLGFGESSLDFMMRAYIRGVEGRLEITHELHMGIDKAFREKGIEIAFPQRDIHIRSFNAPVQIERARSGAAGPGPASKKAEDGEPDRKERPPDRAAGGNDE